MLSRSPSCCARSRAALMNSSARTSSPLNMARTLRLLRTIAARGELTALASSYARSSSSSPVFSSRVLALPIVVNAWMRSSSRSSASASASASIPMRIASSPSLESMRSRARRQSTRAFATVVPASATSSCARSMWRCASSPCPRYHATRERNASAWPAVSRSPISSRASRASSSADSCPSSPMT